MRMCRHTGRDRDLVRDLPHVGCTTGYADSRGVVHQRHLLPTYLEACSSASCSVKTDIPCAFSRNRPTVPLMFTSQYKSRLRMW